MFRVCKAVFSDGTKFSKEDQKSYTHAWMIKWTYSGKVYRKIGFTSRPDLLKNTQKIRQKLNDKPYEVYDIKTEIVPCVCSSAGERSPDTGEVSGSIPLRRTIHAPIVQW